MPVNLSSRVRRYPELAIIAALVIILLLVIDFLKLDLWLVSRLYDENNRVWPLASLPLFNFLNQYFEKVFVVAGVVFSLACILTNLGRKGSPRWRQVGVFMLLSLAIGPGLVVNGVFKNTWGRPRPADTVQFGGTEEFRRVVNPGPGGAPEHGGAGRSFPSGHAAAAFWSTSLFFIARYLLPQRAIVVLATTVGFGALVGVARVVAGRHYPSDVIWSGLLVFAISGLIAYLWLRLPRYPDRQREGS